MRRWPSRPAVTRQDAQTLLLEVQASLRLFGGLPALAPAPGGAAGAAAPPCADGRRTHRAGCGLAGAVATRVAGVTWCWAHTPRSGRPCRALLDAAPVGLLGPAANTGRPCRAWACTPWPTCGLLPRAGLARRFGEGLLVDLDRALGRRADPRRWLGLPATFESRLELHTRAENTEQVLHGAAVLLARLVAWAQAQHARVGAFTLRMLHERQRQTTAPPTLLRVELAEPALDAVHLQGLLRERLARCQLAQPTLELRLHCQRPGGRPRAQWRTVPHPRQPDEGLTRLLERLRARLGDEQVQCLLPVADHRPERASRRVPAQTGPMGPMGPTGSRRCGDSAAAGPRQRHPRGLAAGPPGLAVARAAAAGRA